MPDASNPPMAGDADEAPIVRKPWTPMTVIVSEGRDTQDHVTVFTDGSSPTNHILYGS
jgi:hypothetical protein